MAAATARMRVHLYLPNKLYGFCRGEDGTQVFFHARFFYPGRTGGAEVVPPPIIGEFVDVVYDPESGDGNAPQAQQVLRMGAPKMVEGLVDTFEQKKGWGFILGSDGVSYYLHRCEVLGGGLPLHGDKVSFCAGWKKGRPRACYVHLQR